MILRTTSEILSTTTKVKERDQRFRKDLIDLPKFVSVVNLWQEKRPPLLETDMDLEILKFLLLGEIDEIDEHRQEEGLPDYDFKSEVGEVNDAAFFVAAVNRMLRITGKSIDFNQVMISANGQSNNSASLERMREVSGNLNERSLQKDVQYLWTLWVSYLIHMKFPVNPNLTLEDYTLIKNDGNYHEFMLRNNPIFEMAYGRAMNKEESVEYFSHYKRATRIIRDFMIEHIDPMVEHHGLADKQLLPYRMLIFCFMNIKGIGINPSQALVMIKEQLHKDYDIPQPLDTIEVARV